VSIKCSEGALFTREWVEMVDENSAPALGRHNAPSPRSQRTGPFLDPHPRERDDVQLWHVFNMPDGATQMF